MKTLSIQKTIYPDLDKPVYWEGCRMPKHKYFAMDSELFNRWSVHIHNQLIKCRMWNNIVDRIRLSDLKPTNTVRPGGVCYEDGQEAALKLAKEILG
jgi:regulator of sirC expression with transglutaminase-like and TPR domain